MKRLATWLFIIILTFGFGVTASLLYLKFNFPSIQKTESLPNPVLLDNENVSPDLPILSFCELSNNPEKYNGRIVRTSATIHFGLEGSWFSDSNCGSPDKAAIVSYKNEKVWNAIKQVREPKGKKLLENELNLIVVGKFKNEVYRDCCLIAPFQFEILNVEKATKTN